MGFRGSGFTSNTPMEVNKCVSTEIRVNVCW